MSAIREIRVWSWDADGLVTVKAAPTPVPGLFVNADPDVAGYWSVTHLSSGCAAAPGLLSPEQALRIAIRIGPLTDWTASPQVMLAEVPKIRERVWEILDSEEAPIGIAANRERIAQMEPLS